MEEKVMTNNDEIEIDLGQLVNALVKKAWLISLVSIVCAVVLFFGTYFFVTPTYKSSVKLYVNNSALSSVSGIVMDSISSSDISASRGLVKTYIVILNTRETLNDVIDYAGVDLTYAQVKNMISATAVDSTEVFQVTVTSTDPQEAEKLANAIAYILPNRIKNIVDGTSAKVVEYAIVPRSPSGPSYIKNAVMGFMVGLVLSAGLIVVLELLDVTVRKEEDIARSCTAPVLAAVPDMEASTKGGYYYGYGEVSDSKSRRRPKKPVELVGGSISFAAAEAYKLLRTKLQFSFVDQEGCRVVGLSSALSGEGKTLTAVNLAYSLSQLGLRVLLVDCDMRRPSLAEKLPIDKAPGLSDYLTGQANGDHLIQRCGIKNDANAFHVIASGHTPPNPMELISSKKMEKMIQTLRESYDYILLDLPPVIEVSDALAAAKLSDGMLVVVRQNFCDRISLNTAVRQFAFVDTKILGVVFNSTNESGGHYGSRRYYNRYYRKYAYSYAYAQKQAKEKEEEENDFLFRQPGEK